MMDADDRALSAANELHDLDLGSRTQSGLTPERLFDDLPIKLYGNALGVDFQLFEKSEDGLSFGRGMRFAVYYDGDCHGLG